MLRGERKLLVIQFFTERLFHKYNHYLMTWIDDTKNNKHAMSPKENTFSQILLKT